MFNLYFPNNDSMKTIFGDNAPICISGPDLRARAREIELSHEMLRFLCHVATEEEIARYGVKPSPLSPEDFSMLWACAVECPSSEVFIGDYGIGYFWADIDFDDPIPEERIAFLEALWDAAHMDFEQFAQRAGLPIGDLCRLMGINYRNAHSWATDPKAIPEHVRVMLARAIGMI